MAVIFQLGIIDYARQAGKMPTNFHHQGGWCLPCPAMVGDSLDAAASSHGNRPERLTLVSRHAASVSGPYVRFCTFRRQFCVTKRMAVCSDLYTNVLGGMVI